MGASTRPIKFWNTDFGKYEKYKNERLSKMGDLNTYLMLLEDKNYGFVMAIDDTSIFEDRTTLNLLQNKGVDISQINDETKYIWVCGDDSKVINSSEYSYDNKLFDLGKNVFKISDSRIKVNAFDIDDRSTVVDTSEFGVQKTLGMEERYPNQYGFIVMSSKATRM